MEAGADLVEGVRRISAGRCPIATRLKAFGLSLLQRAVPDRNVLRQDSWIILGVIATIIRRKIANKMGSGVVIDIVSRRRRYQPFSYQSSGLGGITGSTPKKFDIEPSEWLTTPTGSGSGQEALIFGSHIGPTVAGCAFSRFGEYCLMRAPELTLAL
ncbi:MAG TPA: hypothetical protein VMI72_04890 [Roseiarcus sp.]|nr:hypothetical protein [Roseiarcus sp.]